MTKRDKDTLGWAMIILSVLGFVAMAYGAYSVDKARGISVEQSLRANGL